MIARAIGDAETHRMIFFRVRIEGKERGAGAISGPSANLDRIAGMVSRHPARLAIAANDQATFAHILGLLSH